MTLDPRRPGSAPSLLALLAAAALAGCSSPPDPAPKPPAAASLHAPTALLLVGAPDAEALLHERAADASVRPVEFRDEDGRVADVRVDDLRVLSRDWLWMFINPGAGLPHRHVLLHVPDGKVVDAGAPLSWEHALQVKSGDVAYGVAARADGLRVIARVELATMTARFLSDPAADDPWGGYLVVDHEGNVRASVEALVAGRLRVSQKIFLADGSAPVEDPWTSGEGPPSFCDAGGAGGTLATTYGADDHLYVLCAADLADPEGSATTRRLAYFVREVSFTRAGSRFVDAPPLRTVACTGPTPATVTCPESRLDVTPWDDLRPRTRRLTLTSGFFTVSPAASGGLSVAWTDLAIPATAVVSGDYAWWREGDAIRRLRLAAGATADTMATVPGLVRWELVGDELLYTAYVTGAKVATYRVSAPGAAPAVVGPSDPRVRRVVELDPQGAVTSGAR